MKFVHLLSRLTGTFWFITEDALDNITHLLESRIAGVALQNATLPSETTKLPPAAHGMAMIPIHGVIGKGLSPLEMACGGADIEAIERSYDAANADPAVSTIRMHIRSPGGTAVGVPELAQKIYDTKTKPVEAYSDTQIGSAAYYLAAAADRIIVTPSTDVGSIGTVLGIRETINPVSADGRTRLRIFRSGEDKMMGADGPLSEKQAAHLQAKGETLGAMFREFVTTARPGVAASTMTGLSYFGQQAKTLGLVDEVIESISAGSKKLAA